MPPIKQPAKQSFVVSALKARSTFGKLLRRVEQESHSLIIEKRGTPRAILISLRDYVRLAAPEPEILRLLGAESASKGTSRLSARQIDAIISATRSKNSSRRRSQK
jgi:prevent-host-death family protein